VIKTGADDRARSLPAMRAMVLVRAGDFNRAVDDRRVLR
jgi:hypothetical protein